MKLPRTVRVPARATDLIPNPHVYNLHARDIAAPPERVWASLTEGWGELGLHPFFRVLFRVRGWVGKKMGWEKPRLLDPPAPESASAPAAQPAAASHNPDESLAGSLGMKRLTPETQQGIFRVTHWDPPRELIMSPKNEMIEQCVLAFILVPEGAGTRVYNLTTVRWAGWFGRVYWLVIWFWHDRITADLLARLARHAERPT